MCFANSRVIKTFKSDCKNNHNSRIFLIFVPEFESYSCQDYSIMAYTGRLGQSDEFRREELIRVIEHSVEKLTLQELEALYYDMSTKNYINESW